MNTTAAQRRAGWLTAMIERARGSGLGNEDIAAALEDSIVFHPVTIDKDNRNRLVGMMTDDEITVTDLFDLPDENPPTR
jgi:hypothetical protein